MATVPLSGTDILFLSGVPFSNDYKHTRWFDDVNTQFDYFRNQPLIHRMQEANFQRTDDGRAYVKVNKSIDELFNTNYMMFNNYKISQKWFYAFVTKLEYKNSALTYVYFEIDILQTWRFDYTFKPSYVVREHCQLWNSDGTPVINTVDEGLNYGSEYKIAKVDQYRAYSDLYFLVIVSKQIMHGSSPNTFYNSVNGIPQNMCYYVTPFRLDGTTPSCNFTLSPLVGVVANEMFNEDKTVNNIVSMYVTDMLPDNPSYDGTTISFDSSHYEAATIGTAQTVFVTDVHYSSWIKDMGNKYDGFTPVSETKLMMHPYTTTVITDFKGNHIELKNEYIDSPDLILDIRGSLGLSNKTVYSVKDYLTGLLSDDSQKEKVSMNNALIDDNPNDLPVMTDMLSAYIQGNRNSIQNQKNSILFNGYTDGLGSGIGALAAGAQGNAAGLAAGITGMVKGGGNAVLGIQAIQAKLQDISNVPPTLAKMGGNSYFDYGNGYTGIWVIKKEITQEYRQKLSDFFNCYGYKVNDIKLPNFHTRQTWNYVQTKDCVITGNFNTEDLNELKSVFDNGITLWHVDDVGNYTIPNAEL